MARGVASFTLTLLPLEPDFCECEAGPQGCADVLAALGGAAGKGHQPGALCVGRSTSPGPGWLRGERPRDKVRGKAMDNGLEVWNLGPPSWEPGLRRTVRLCEGTHVHPKVTVQDDSASPLPAVGRRADS